MKTKNLIIAVCVVALLGCNKKPASENQTKSASTANELNVVPTLAVPDTFKVALGGVYEGYIQIQKALAQDDLLKAKAAFSTMHALLHVIPKDVLDSTVTKVWSVTDARIMETLHPMATAVTLDSTRAYFMDFSREFSDAINTFGLPPGTSVYRFHCPMANGNQGADWMQKDSVLANPYFGKSMLTCGSRIKETNG